MDRTAPLAGSLAGQVISSGKPGLVTGDRLQAAVAALGAGIGPLIAVPLAAGERVLGALLLGRTAARPGFTESDLGMAASFAAHAAVAMELARARADQILLAQAEDHERIAGDLHDHVIQELFALGMKLQGQAARSDPATAERVNGYIDTLDEVIKKIRASIFGLQQPRQAPVSLQARVWRSSTNTPRSSASPPASASSARPVPASTRRSPTTSWPSPARPCPTAPATPTPPPSPSP